jgi:GNAT superfamily N-acetyltransferase
MAIRGAQGNTSSAFPIRALRASDSLDELTALLHCAYAPLGALGFNYTAVDQDTATTQRRLANGEGYVMLDGDTLVGAIVVVPPSTRATYCAWYDRPEVAVLSQYAVEPRLQGQGLGSRLLRFAEHRASELGATEAALDTAERAAHLVRFYQARGYREVGRERWANKTYRSVLLSKGLASPHSAVSPK